MESEEIKTEGEWIAGVDRERGEMVWEGGGVDREGGGVERRKAERGAECYYEVLSLLMQTSRIKVK